MKHLAFLAACAAPLVLAANPFEYIDLSVDCGNFTNRDQYPTYGYEQQLYTCREIVLAAQMPLKVEKLRFNIEWAPLYESIQYKAGLASIRGDEGGFEYREDPDTGESLDAQTRNLDWYNNIGDRTYFFG